jgi:hypothetical protein
MPKSNRYGRKRPYTEFVNVDLGDGMKILIYTLEELQNFFVSKVFMFEEYIE